MKKIVILSALFLGIFFLAGLWTATRESNTVNNTRTRSATKGTTKKNTTTQTTVPTETLNYCGRAFVAEKIEIDGVSIVNRILQLAITKDKDNCINFEQINNIAVLKKVEGDTTSITLYEKNSLTDADKQSPIDRQIEKINSNEKYPQTNEYVIKGDSIYVVSKFDGAETLLGKLK